MTEAMDGVTASGNEHDRRGVSRAATTMGAATLLSRVVGFVRILVIAAVLGTTYLGNTFQASNSMSNVLFELLAAGALSAVLVPTFVRLLDAGRHDDAERLAGGLLGLAIVVLGAVSLAGVLAAPLLARVLTSGGVTGVAHDQRVLTTFLLRFFVPQVVLYAVGTVAIGVLQAQRRFSVPALAPIGNTVVMVGFLIAFHVLRAGQAPSLHLSLAERLCLAAGGTLGVAAFVAIPFIALRGRGFRLRPRWDPNNAGLREIVRLSSWGVLQHAGIGVLLAAALVVGNRVAGGVVAYQVAFVFFLVPYAVVAQPIHTTILPEMAGDVGRGDLAGLGRATRWAVSAMAFFVVPGAAVMVALALPTMKVVTFGRTGAAGAQLIAAALAGLAAGLPAYGGFLLLSRAYYALGDSRTPALAAVSSACLGALAMAIVAPRFEGAGRIAAMGLAHTAAYAMAAVVLLAGLRRRTGVAILASGLLTVAGAAAVAGLGAWLLVRIADPSGRLATAAVVVAASCVAAALYWVLARGHVPNRIVPVAAG